jgi:uncharacterized protein YndB with AHSA1/START domain
VSGPVRTVTWRVHLASPRADVYEILATDAGRARFWAQSAVERDGRVEFHFPNGARWSSVVLEREPPARFAVTYIGGSRATFELAAADDGGTDLTLTDAGVPDAEYDDARAGWVSVLLALKAAADFGVDLRSHDARRTWDDGYVDN